MTGNKGDYRPGERVGASDNSKPLHESWANAGVSEQEHRHPMSDTEILDMTDGR